MKVGRLAPAEEEDRVRAARQAIGPSAHLMLDANNAWSDLPTALLYCKRYEKYDPYWIEEPFSPDDIENHAKLAARSAIAVATGEIEAGGCNFAGRRRIGKSILSRKSERGYAWTWD
jgi:L-alanine-DL-glutamate epimerase-like enolase superfamily enzyme